MNKSIEGMTKEDFDAVPHWEYVDVDFNVPFNSLIILPTEKIHESGYRCMDFVMVSTEGKAVCKLSGNADLLNIDGIGGYGPVISGPGSECVRVGDKLYIQPKGWSIDCLPCGYLRLFARKTLYLRKNLD